MRLRAVISITALLGVLLSLYMLVSHFTPSQSFCNLGERFNCDAVNRSPFGKILGIPVAAFGVLNYLLVLALILGSGKLAMLSGLGERTILLVLVLYSLFGLLFSAYLTAVEAFILYTYCPLCLLSALFTIIIFVCAVPLWRSTKY